MPASRKRHPLDDVLVADLCDVHCKARFLAQAKRPDTSADMHRQARPADPRADSSITRSASLNRRIASIAPDAAASPPSLIHDFAIEATRLGLTACGQVAQSVSLQAMRFWRLPSGPGCGLPLKPGLRPVFTLRARIPDAGAAAPGASVARRRRQRKRAGGPAVAGEGPGERLPAPVAEQTHDPDGNSGAGANVACTATRSMSAAASASAACRRNGSTGRPTSATCRSPTSGTR